MRTGDDHSPNWVSGQRRPNLELVLELLKKRQQKSQSLEVALTGAAPVFPGHLPRKPHPSSTNSSSPEAVSLINTPPLTTVQYRSYSSSLSPLLYLSARTCIQHYIATSMTSAPTSLDPVKMAIKTIIIFPASKSISFTGVLMVIFHSLLPLLSRS